MTIPDNTDTWRKSSRSQPDSNCVEVALESSRARVRDTKNRLAGHLEVTPAAWQALLERL